MKEGTRTRGRWYERIPAQDRIAIDAVAKWLRPVRWQWFVTLTFPWNVRVDTADRKLMELINMLERALHTNICIVAGKEAKPSSHGRNVPWHFHILMTSHVPIPKATIKAGWDRLARLRISDQKSISLPDSAWI